MTLVNKIASKFISEDIYRGTFDNVPFKQNTCGRDFSRICYFPFVDFFPFTAATQEHERLYIV